MATRKITITLPDHQTDSIRELVATGKAENMSAFVKHAVGAALFDGAGWRAMLDDALRQTVGLLRRRSANGRMNFFIRRQQTKLLVAGNTGKHKAA